MIRLQHVTCSYPGQLRPALKDLTLSFAEGESVCVMGANGCGKSTLAKLMAGLLKPDEGSSVVTGADRQPLAVGILFQNPDNQMVAVTVDKEIAFALENLGTPRPLMQQMVKDTLKRFRIEHLLSRLTSELSGGEKQRLALASVMVFSPPILVLDEPDSFLDESGKRVLREELDRIKEANPDLIEVRFTQYPSVAAQYKRLIVLDRGALAVDAAPESIFADRAASIRLGIAFDSQVLPGSMPMLEPPLRAESGPGFVDEIAVNRLSFGYIDQLEIISNLSFRLRRGEVLGMVGPSGSGKSSLGHLLCGLMRPTKGRITFVDGQGQTIDPEDIRGRVAGLFQQPERQFFLPRCADEITFGPANLGAALEADAVSAYFDMVGLAAAEFSGRDPFTLSGGEKRRLAFAAVLSMSPQFVVFDEPTCGLDQEGVGRFVGLIRTLQANRTGIVLITHDGDIIYHLADRVLHFQGDGSHELLSTSDFFADAGHRSVVSPRSRVINQDQN